MNEVKQPLVNPFALLGLAQTMSLDLPKAEAQYKELAKALHPDKYTNASATERRLALSKAIEVNEAWRIVRDPIKRAETLFALSGLADEIGENKEAKPDQTFLLEVLEKREALEMAKRQRDIDIAEHLVGEASTSLEELLSELTSAYEASASMEQLRKLIPLLGRLRYTTRWSDEAKAVYEQLLDEEPESPLM